MLIKKKIAQKVVQESVDKVTGSATTAKKVMKEELKHQLDDLSDFVKKSQEMKKQQDELVRSLEKLAQGAAILKK